MNTMASVLLLILMLVEAVWSVDKSFSKILQHIEFNSSGGRSE